ncbi:hypothetical protein CVT25_002930 [Psilocybe cyanescens]|uniref:protein-serine/threonine phosphatase n=1 Tax=Psilocybe cyanescens TaxID=93625 RepID=A0A409WMZ1_PSICY|nr:hypothetical protein CVT25_002930 [Psilocybe cyanescens]
MTEIHRPQGLDLSQEADVRAYLAETPFASTDVVALSGGTANYVFRLRLATPYRGKRTVVLKHAKQYVKDLPQIAFELGRQIYEVEALRRVGAWLTPDSIVTVPEVHLFDWEAHVIIMDDAGEDSISLKAFMQQGRATPAIAQKIGAAVGAFLGGMHRWGKGNQELCEAVKGNAQAKAMSAWVFYGRLLPTLSGDSGLPKLQDPPLVAAQEDLEAIKGLVEETTQALLAVDDQFVMGDFWPGNLMMQLDERGGLTGISVLDWELTKTGLSGLDVGQFCAEIHLLRRSQPEVCQETASLVLEHFFREYKRTCEPEVEVVKRTLVQWGTHMAILGARVEWGNKDISREIVLEGVRILVDGYKSSESVLRDESLVETARAMDESEPTPLHLPQNLPYPLKITSLNAQLNSNIDRKSRLVEYSFVYTPAGPEQIPETRFGTWDSTVEGVVKAWKVKVGDVISRKRAADSPALFVEEPCKHEVQIGGLCALCAKDMTITDYLDAPDTARANIQMTHSAHGPTVSLEYAKRIEREAADHLLKSRKLSLIVDLDQTIVHATVDPTVGEWINEGEAWEARQAKKASTTPRDDGAEQTTAPEPDDDDECNPNWEALKDVKSFRLGPESFGPPAVRGAHRGKGKNKMVETEGCMYYIKPRPGWKEFLRETATKYEMHVYTMGTRAYAEEVCAAIDPDGNIFGGRLLSRDESGSLTQKNLKRLFPSDTSMVVIIDDRADVWEWSPNLLKVIPYDFFVGIGDINSSFLPKIEPLTPSVLNMPTPTSVASINGTTNVSTLESNANPIDADTSSTVPTIAPDEEITELETAMFTQNNAALDAQLEERPLAKKEKELQEHEIQEQQGAEQAPAEETSASAENLPTPTPSPKPEKTHKKALLKNDDYELDRIGKLLNEVHTRFFSAYDARRSSENARTKAGSAKSFDVTRIIPRIRSEVFDGVHILFSSVIPLDTKPESTEIWRMAHMFGAQCSTELTSNITHVVAAKRGTVKVDMARRRGGIKIVWLAWFTDSIALWRRQDEKPYLLDDPPVVIPNSSPNTEYHQLSSDLDIDSDDWDQEPSDMKETGGLQLEAINWDDINDEVEAAMNESDDDDDDNEYYVQGMKSDNASEDDWTDGGANNTAQPTTRKRFRSSTPSDSGGNDDSGNKSRKRIRSATPSDAGNDYGSPLARRKKVAFERSGYSKLKEGITADDIGTTKDGNASNGSALPDTKVSSPGIMYEDDGDDEEEEEEEEEDFLARELEEEWG